MNKAYSAVLLLLLSTIAPIHTPKLSRVEKKLVETVAQNHTEAIDFLEQVVNINSGTMNLEGVKKVGQEFSDAFDALNFETTWIEMPSEMNRAGHLLATIKGNKGKKILLIGHLDTVFEKDSPFQKFTMLNDSIAIAPGGNDMKGGDVIVLYALKALHENGLLEDAQISVILIGDEESTGSPLEEARKELVELAKQSDVALAFEFSKGLEYATAARRGFVRWNLEAKGVRSHSSRIFSEDVGAGAILEMSRILNSFYEEMHQEEYFTFNPGVALGGTNVALDQALGAGEVFGKRNVVAQKAVAQGEFRYISEEQKETAIIQMKEIVARHLPQTTAEITFLEMSPAMPPTEGNTALLNMLSDVSVDLGQGEVKAYDPGARGGADISHIAKYLDCLDGLGAYGEAPHTLNETVDINSIEAQSKRIAIMIYRLINS